MVIGIEDKKFAQMLTLLENLGISASDCALAEEYLIGKVGDEVLDQFQRMDFSAAQITDEVRKELGAIEWEMHGDAMWQRLFNVLFAIGPVSYTHLRAHETG